MTKGTHHIAFVAQPAFAMEAKLAVLGTNMWRPGTPGHRFYAEVLMLNPTTVQECIDKAAALAEPFSAKQIQGHLRWMYTTSGGPLEVNGVRFEAPPAVEKPKPVKVEKPKPVKAPKAKKVKEAA